jgi:2,5-diamino-6-(ribosylamino)-4(3H)-pyrimidinone 5'-phosphate reductase
MSRPYVIINCAMSADGKIASSTGKQIRISSKEDIDRMYHLRNECDAVLVGVNTILSDDPKLTVKEKYVKNPVQPVRIILDSNCKTPRDALAVNYAAKTLIITTKKCDNKYGENVEIIPCKQDEESLIDLNDMLDKLYSRDIKKLMVEGGSRVIWNFLKQRLVDDMFVYIDPMIIGGENTPSLAKNREDFENLIELKIVDEKKLGPGTLVHYSLIK